MSIIRDLSVSQLRQALEIKEKIESLEAELAAIIGGGAAPAAPAATETNGAPGRRKMSAQAKAKIRAAQIARWARFRGESPKAPSLAEPAVKKKRKVSAAVKARLSEIARQRWAKARASGKSAL